MVNGRGVRIESQEIQETRARPQKASTEDTLRSQTSACVDPALAPGASQQNRQPPGSYTLKGLVAVSKSWAGVGLVVDISISSVCI